MSAGWTFRAAQVYTCAALNDSFIKKNMEKYEEEARQRWGDTELYKQSTERMKKMGKEGLARVAKEGEQIAEEIAAKMDRGPIDAAVQTLIAKHYHWLSNFYEPNLEMYRGLGQMYVDDPRFTDYYEKIAPGMAQFMRDAIVAYCDVQSAN